MTYSILIIGGQADLRSELASILHEVGFAVAATPDFPLPLLERDGFKPDIVIIDEVLPGQDPIEACYKLRNLFGIPVVLLGTDSSDEAWRRMMEADADLYLVKPIRQRELIARVKAILRRYPSPLGKRNSRWKKREGNDMKGLTAIEVLIVVAILIILGVVVIPRLLELAGR